MVLTNKNDGVRDANGNFIAGNQAARKNANRKYLPRQLIAEAVSPEDMKEILRLGAEEAKREPGGQWGMFFASRLWAPAKPMAPLVEFDMDTTDPTAAAQDVLNAVSKGLLSSDQGKDLLASLASVRQMMDAEELHQELAELRDLVSKLAK